MKYESNTTMKKIAERLRGAGSVMLTTHTKPDGDAMGAVVAMGGALEKLGKKVEIRVMGPVARNLGVLTSRAKVVEHQEKKGKGIEASQCVGGTGEKGSDAFLIGEPDVVMVLDTGAWSQLEGLREWLSSEGRREKTIVIDHHQRGDDVGAMLYVDAKAAAACELVAELIDELGVKRDGLMVDALFVGIATDTGWFRFSNTTAKTHELAAKLVREGADTAAMYAATEQCDRANKLALLQRALNSLRFVAGGRGVVMVLRQKDFDETGARIDETERFVDVPQFVGEVEVVALVVEEKGRTRMSLRSKPGERKGTQGGARGLARPWREGVDVNELAGQFGGGGHQRAAGAKTDQPADEVVKRLVKAIEERMGGAEGPGAGA